ncbi:MAG: hypothetical protein KDA84_16410, partial [Planctomycetaceae bacterium]|nr:hypothetical protein [Planctomycetaceae bacterium]
GSGSNGCIDAIQLEFGAALRSRDENSETAEKLANAITAYSQKFLPRHERGDTIRLGVYHDVGVGRSVNDLLDVLKGLERVSVQTLDANDVRSGALADLDLLIHPGGSGSKQGRHLGEEGRSVIRQFVEEGGGFIGLCAGSYLASADYDWSLHLLDAKVIDRKHWNRGQGTVDIEMTDAGRELLHMEFKSLSIHYAQGPLLAPANRPDLEDFRTLATFETEIARNGAPIGVMKGTTAIAFGRYGHGRVLCFSPHPEKTNGLEFLVNSAIKLVSRSPDCEEVP